MKERTAEDLRGLIVELVAVDASGKDQLSALDQSEMQKLWSIFSHQKLDMRDIVAKVGITSLGAYDSCTAHQVVWGCLP